jgi:hypothetical protein
LLIQSRVDVASGRCSVRKAVTVKAYHSYSSKSAIGIELRVKTYDVAT